MTLGVVSGAVIGVSAASIASGISLAERLGWTPAMLHMRTRFWSSQLLIGAVPIEYVAVMWFVAVLTFYGRGVRNTSSVALAFFGAAPVAAMSVWFLWVRNSQCWPVAGIAIGGALVMIGAALDSEAWNVPAPRLRPWARASLVTFVAAAIIGGAAIHMHAGAVPPKEALRADLLRWYASRKPRPAAMAGGLVGQDVVRVTVFTDYQSNQDRFDVPRKRDMLDSYRRRGLAVEWDVRDFPQDASCNPRTSATGPDRPHDAACEAAYAVRLVRDLRGANEAASLGDWLYRRGPALSPTVVRERLAELGLGAELETRYASVKAAVAKDIQLGRDLQLYGTPVYFVDGVWVPQGADVIPWIVSDRARPIASTR